MYFVLKNCSLTICKSWRVRVWPVTWGLTLGFDRLKTTPDRSALGAGCTTTLNDGQRQQNYIKDTRVIKRANFEPEHQVVRSRLAFSVSKPHKKRKQRHRAHWTLARSRQPKRSWRKKWINWKIAQI